VSRGLGRVQRQLLDVLKTQPAVFLIDLLPLNYSHKQYVSLNRAAHLLNVKGRVGIMHSQLAGGCNSIWVVRPGYQCNRDQVPRFKLSV
jgi:hypothetical protein